MAAKTPKPSGWIVQRMSDLEEESRHWPAWKQQDLKDRLERDELRCADTQKDEEKKK